MGLELEYFLVRRREDGSIELADKLDTLEKPCYDITGLTRQYDFLTTVSKYANELGWGNYANDHEDANGQFEQNFTYDDALTTCDRAIFFRYMVHTLAEQRGMIATFMPKPFSNLTGNGCHFHMSLWKDGENVFLDEADPRGLGLSETAYQFIGGLLQARTRLQRPDGADRELVQAAQGRARPRSGATWSPVWISYGYNNRTQMLRIPGPGRIEDRTIDGSCNPYLAAAAVLAAGLDGIANGARAGRAELGEPLRDPVRRAQERGASRRCPRTCSRRRTSSSGTTCSGRRSAAGATRTTSTTSSSVKRDEWARYHEQVTPWEIDEYLTRF